jgi:prolyl oligopeptidase
MRRSFLWLVLLGAPFLAASGRAAALAEVEAAEDARQASASALAEAAASDDAALRARAARAWGRIQQPAGVDPLLRLLDDPAPEVRREAVFALGQMGWVPQAAGGREAEIALRLQALLGGADEGLRAAAVEAIGKIGLERTSELVVPLLADASAAVRAEAALALFRHRLVQRLRAPDAQLEALPQPAMDALLRAAGDPAAEARRAVAIFFAREKDARGLEAVVKLSRDTEPWTRFFATVALRRFEEPAAVEAAAAAARDADAHVRLAAVQALAAQKQGGRVSAELARDPSLHIRAAVAEALGTLETGDPAMLEALLDDTSPTVRAAALVAAARRRAEAAGEQVRRALENESWLLREAAVAAAATLPETGEELLLQAAKDLDERVRAAAIGALAARDSGRARQAVEAALSASGLAERGTAVEALRGRTDEASAALAWRAYQASQGPEWPEIREALLEVLAARTGPEIDGWLREALEDPAPQVALAARRALEARGEQQLPEVPPPPKSVSPHAARRFERNPIVVLETTKGALRIEAFATEAPVHVANLAGLVRAGFYDGLSWHRVVPNFVVQGGDPLGTGWGDPGWALRAEVSPLRYERGTLGMPRSQGFDTGGCQLFLTHVPTPHLDGQYAVFGKVVEGLDVLDRIERGDRILKATLVEPDEATAHGAPAGTADAAEDPYLWLEDVDGERAQEWVRARNAQTEARLGSDETFQTLYREALELLDAPSRLPSVTQKGAHLYNFWRDEQHPRGLYRRTTLDELRKDEPAWQTVLDVDALARAEGKPWAFKGMQCLPPEHRRCLVWLSPGGGDAVEVRELDAQTLAFVDGGFRLPVAKSRVAWQDADTLFVATDFGEGSMTASGYPRIVKLWRRGTPLADARTVHEGEISSMSVAARRLHTGEGHLDLVFESLGFWTGRRFLLEDGTLQRLELPETAVIEGATAGRLVVSLKQDWQRDGLMLKQGSVLVADPGALRGRDGHVAVLAEPVDGKVIESVEATDRAILITYLEDVRARMDVYEPSAGGWTRRSVPFPDNGSLYVRSADDDTGDVFVELETFLTPPTLYHVAAPDWQPVAIRAQAPTFDGDRFTVDQSWAVSKDGTRVPYFLVRAKELELDGKNPTHIFSYGGFRNSLTPSYSGSYEPHNGAYGKLWLERGGVFVLANIRGGGEFGPAWHEAALREKRPRSFEDFEAVAEDLIARKITSARHIGIEGRSNGGLLVAAAFTRRPELYGAVVCGMPLADMRRYHRLLAGASWMAEYGDPDDPADWAFLSQYSPYQNLAAGKAYPPVLFYTSTRDDRVHPGHARKMAARMLELGHEIAYHENTEGGHGGSVTNEQLARRIALSYAHLWRRLR